jgi:aminoglycoside 3-N-acetyltransferase
MAEPAAVVTQAEIEAGLRALGLEAGDTALVHSSLRSFGHVEGGPEAVIEALIAAVGARGCIVMPALTLGASECPVVLDARHSPSTSGAITEAFRLRPDVRRSHHPTSSAAAWGWAADELTRHHTDTPCGLASPYGQVYLRGGWCLFLGAPWTSNTMFHVAEELVMGPYLRFAEFRDATVVDEDGRTETVAFRRYNCYQSGVRRDLEAVGARLEADGLVRTTCIAASACRLVRARDVIGTACEMLLWHTEEVVSYDR